jgi:uncharacterized membrane protein YeaQ/YmgE (transglycosylase-associated protein family)
MVLKNSKILRVAGFSFIGFCAVSMGVDRVNIGPVASQIAGFCGAFVGGWVGARRRRVARSEEVTTETLAKGLVEDRSSEHVTEPRE